MNMYLNSYMVSYTMHFKNNKDVVPAIIIFKKGKRQFTLALDKIKYRSWQIKGLPHYMITYFQACVSDAFDTITREKLSEKCVKKAFRLKGAKVYRIILLHAENKMGVCNPSEFHFRRDSGLGIDVQINKKVYNNLRLHKNLIIK